MRVIANEVGRRLHGTGVEGRAPISGGRQFDSRFLFKPPDSPDPEPFQEDDRTCLQATRRRLLAPLDWRIVYVAADGALCAALVLELLLVGRSLAQQGILLQLCVALLLTDACAHRVRELAGHAGDALASWAAATGRVAYNALKDERRRVRWCDQTWQLAAHLLFTAVESRILSDEPWLRSPRTVWLPHPYEQIRQGWRPELKVRAGCKTSGECARVRACAALARRHSVVAATRCLAAAVSGTAPLLRALCNDPRVSRADGTGRVRHLCRPPVCDHRLCVLVTAYATHPPLSGTG
jgi:hypothetical protein